MGNYARTNAMISEMTERLERYEAQLNQTSDPDEIDRLVEDIIDLKVGIGECEGYLEELASEDGYDSYYDYVDAEIEWLQIMPDDGMTYD